MACSHYIIHNHKKLRMALLRIPTMKNVTFMKQLTPQKVTGMMNILKYRRALHMSLYHINNWMIVTQTNTDDRVASRRLIVFNYHGNIHNNA